MDITKVLEESIIKVFDEDDNEIKFTKKEVKWSKAKYSSAKKPSKCLFLDGKQLANNKKHLRKVLYRCSCGSINKVLLCKFLEKDKLTCFKCRETKEKREWHKLFFKMQKEGLERGHIRKDKTVYDFENEPDSFKDQYFKINLKENEFNSIKKYIYSINDIVVGDEDIKFVIAKPCKNASKYCQAVVIGDGNEVNLQNIYLKCPICGTIFHITRHLKERYLANNFDCMQCYLSNKIFAPKTYRDGLTYQGNEELKFIKRCDENKIQITNGIKIKYPFNDKIHTYITDFWLPEEKYMVEIKDNHIWHKKQIDSGKWQAKENAAIKYANENNYKYFLLFPKDVDAFFESIKR